MKYSFHMLLFLSVAVLNSCKNCECTSENTLAMNDTIFDNQFECLDIDYLSKYGVSIMSNPEGPYDYYVKETYSDGVIKSYIQGDNGSGYTYYFNLDSLDYISIHRIYYSDGKIKIKGLYNDLGFRIGKWYKFSSSGNLSETIDTERGFDFTFEQLKEKVTKEEKISFNNLPVVDTGIWGNEYPISIQKDTENQPMWRVRYKDKDNSKNGIYGTEVEIYYDGKTGEQISKDFIRIM